MGGAAGSVGNVDTIIIRWEACIDTVRRRAEIGLIFFLSVHGREIFLFLAALPDNSLRRYFSLGLVRDMGGSTLGSCRRAW